VAQPFGQVTMALPQGAYQIQPGATVVLPDGTQSTATFQPIQLSLGCGQRVSLVPGLAVSLDQLPGCAGAAAVVISGQVQSGGLDVDHVWYQVNGGAPVDICSSGCGADPTFSVTAPLAACTNSIQVFASSPYVNGVASTTDQITWDDPSDGQVCGDGSCGCRDGRCPHDKCAIGAALGSGSSACVTSICAVDPHCCTVQWDSSCVNEVQSVCNNLTCSASQGACGHTLCCAGSALTAGCDAPPAATSCVASICAADSYCCSVYWDDICVGEVASVCGKSCD
jgi:hypothetical protein